MDILAIAVQIILGVIIVAPVLWVAGRALVGDKKAKFTDAIWIVVLGIVIGVVIGALISSFLSSIIMFFVWLGLIKHFFDCGWLKAFAIAIVAVIIFVVIASILAVIGIGIVGLSLGGL